MLGIWNFVIGKLAEATAKVQLRSCKYFMVCVQAEMRKRLAADNGATYTYSMDYVSQTVSLVDESRLREDEKVSINVDGAL